jgi:hypothetical protein
VVAYRRIIAARRARRFPAILPAIADGRLHLTAVMLLSPHLTQDKAADLLEAVTHKTKAEIKVLLAARFPQPDLPTILEPVDQPRLSRVLVATNPTQPLELSPAIVPPLAPAKPDVSLDGPPVARVTPLAPGGSAFKSPSGRKPMTCSSGHTTFWAIAFRREMSRRCSPWPCAGWYGSSSRRSSRRPNTLVPDAPARRTAGTSPPTCSAQSGNGMEGDAPS